MNHGHRAWVIVMQFAVSQGSPDERISQPDSPIRAVITQAYNLAESMFSAIPLQVFERTSFPRFQGYLGTRKALIFSE